MKKHLLLAASLVACLSFTSANAQCEAQTALNEDFSTFTEGPLPQNCWTASHGTPQVTVNATGSLQVYSFFNANTPFYVVSPELVAIDGNHALSFDAYRMAGSGEGTITLQVGTLSDPADFSGFTAVGDAVTLTEDTEPFTGIVIPASETQKYIVFKVIATAVHIAAAIDNVVWQENEGPACTAVAALDESFTSFTQGPLPQNCWTASHVAPNVTINEEGVLQVYSFFNVNTPFYVVSPELTTIDGNHALSFDAYRMEGSGEGEITLQIGTLSDPADFSGFNALGDAVTLTEAMEPFTNIVIPASETQKYIAFKVIATATHIAAGIDNVVWNEIPQECPALDSLNEDFSTFTDAALPQNCWTSSHASPNVTVGEGFIQIYSFFNANTPFYVVSPELTSIDGEKTLSFDAIRQAGSSEGEISVQVGTLSDPADFGSFLAASDAITLTTENGTFSNISIPASNTQKHIVFKFIATGTHMAASFDNVVYQENLSTGNFGQAGLFSVYPNPASGSVNLTLSGSAAANAAVSIYSVTGARVYSAQLATGSSTTGIDLSGLAAGLYIVKVETSSQSVSKKLIVK